jgi:glycosyltransferase involved in cell wall biosynthesis
MSTRHEPLVSLILVTRRPTFLAGIVGMMAAQTYRRTELVVVLHGHAEASPPSAARTALAISAARVLAAPAAWTLGECMNAGIEAARGELVAKVDDDDLYGPAYLNEAVAAFRAGMGEVIGKMEVYVQLVLTGELLIIWPGACHHEQDYLAGPTLLLSTALAREVVFRPLAVGCDTAFLEDCRAAGHRLYATSRRHFVERRFATSHHTWTADVDWFQRNGVVVRRDVALDSAPALLRLVA